MARHTAEDLAERLGHTADYWSRRARRREVPHRRVGKDVWWEDEDLDAILAGARVEPIDPLRTAVPQRRRTA